MFIQLCLWIPHQIHDKGTNDLHRMLVTFMLRKDDLDHST